MNLRLQSLLLIRNHWHRIAYAFRGTTASITALACAELYNLECPYWAALTALIVIQPTRGLIYEKSIYRLVGTATGALAGLLLLIYFPDEILLSATLAIWILGCTFIGSLLYGNRSYACMMAGLTCAVITMSAFLNPGHIYTIAFSRVASIFIGITVATLFTAFFTPKQTLSIVAERLTRLAPRATRWLAHSLENQEDSDNADEKLDILIEIAEIESLIDVALAGTFHQKSEVQRINNQLSSLLSLLGMGSLLTRQLTHNEIRQQHPQLIAQLSEQLQIIGEHLDKGHALEDLSGLEKTVCRLRRAVPELYETLDDLYSILRHGLLENQEMPSVPGGHSRETIRRHRDWQSAFANGLRAGIAIFTGGLIWHFGGWQQGPLLIMAMAIMLTIFATKDHPSHILKQVLLGASIGACSAVIIRYFVLGGNTNASIEYLALTPVLLLGLFGSTRSRTAIIATDATYNFILVMQPGQFTEMTLHDLTFGVMAMILGIGSAWAAYRYLFPAHPLYRIHSLLDSILKDIKELALERHPAAIERKQALVRHKIIRYVLLAKHDRTNYLSFIDGGLLVLTVLANFQQLRRLFADNNAPGNARTILRNTLGELKTGENDYQKLQPVLEQAFQSTRTMIEQQHKPNIGDLDLKFGFSLHSAADLLADSLRTLEGHKQQLRA